MAKKTDSKIKPAAPAKAVAKPAEKTKPVAAKAKPKAAPAASAAPAPAPAAAPKATPKAAAKTPKTGNPGYTQDDVARRAYFISEKRRAHGLPGDEHHDWIEAERQLAAESKAAKKVKKA